MLLQLFELQLLLLILILLLSGNRVDVGICDVYWRSIAHNDHSENDKGTILFNQTNEAISIADNLLVSRRGDHLLNGLRLSRYNFRLIRRIGLEICNCRPCWLWLRSHFLLILPEKGLILCSLRRYRARRTNDLLLIALRQQGRRSCLSWLLGL